jgi:hypothetical protein
MRLRCLTAFSLKSRLEREDHHGAPRKKATGITEERKMSASESSKESSRNKTE